MSTYTKVIIEADCALVQGFVRGWCTAQGMSPYELGLQVLWPQEWDVRVTTLLEGIVEALKPGQVCVVLVEENLLPKLLQAMEPWSESMGVRSQRRIQDASFSFHFEIFERKAADAVRELFTALPEGVRVSGDYQPEVLHTGDGQGMYAPTHEYVFRGKGSISGPLHEVLEVHERCGQYERVHAGDVTLHLEPEAAGGP